MSLEVWYPVDTRSIASTNWDTARLFIQTSADHEILTAHIHVDLLKNYDVSYKKKLGCCIHPVKWKHFKIYERRVCHAQLNRAWNDFYFFGGIVVVVFVFNVPPTAKVIWRRGHGLKSHPTGWWNRESNLRPLVYKARVLSTTPRRLHFWSYWLPGGVVFSYGLT